MFGKFRGQPRGVFVMFATEFWERFSYYGFMGIMVLFMVADLNAGGLGYDRSRALFLFGLFSSFMWFMPLLGGWLADKFLGPRLAVLLGCIGLAGGNFLLAASSFAAKGGEVQTAMVFFVTGIVTMIAGAGLFKSNASALLGQLFGPNDPRREVGFILFYMGINMGALFAPFGAGTAGERIGCCQRGDPGRTPGPAAEPGRQRARVCRSPGEGGGRGRCLAEPGWRGRICRSSDSGPPGPTRPR